MVDLTSTKTIAKFILYSIEEHIGYLNKVLAFSQNLQRAYSRNHQEHISSKNGMYM